MNSNPVSPRRMRRKWFPLVTVTLGIAGFFLLSPLVPDLSRQNRIMVQYAIVLLGSFLVGLWLIIDSGFSRWKTTFVLLLIPTLFFGILTVDFDGDMRPSFYLRPRIARWFGISHDDDLARHRRQQQDQTAVVEIDLTPQETDFPGYGGADRTGIVRHAAIAKTWSQPPRALWKQPVGEGYAAFAVVNDFLFTIEQRRNLEAKQDEEVVVCYHAVTGRELWTHAWPERFDEFMGGAGPRATPTVVDGEVYAVGGKGFLVCLEGRTGKRKWGVPTLQGRSEIRWGMSGSPLIWKNLVIVNPGPPNAVVAYDRATGNVVWAQGNHPAGYSSPMIQRLAGEEQILLFDGEGIAGYRLSTGKELWRFPWRTMNGINVAQPVVVGENGVFISSNYGKGGVMLEVTRNETDSWKVQPLWDTDRKAMRCKFTSPVAYQGYLYGLDEGVLQCIDLKDGTPKWKDGREPKEGSGSYGHGQLLLCDDRLVVLTQFGELALVEATPDRFRELGRAKYLKGEKTWNHFAISGGIAYIRNHLEMAAVDLR